MTREQRIEKLKNGSDTAIWAAAEIERLREALEGILNADWRQWEELASPEEFVRWAKSRAQHALTHNAKITGGDSRDASRRRLECRVMRVTINIEVKND